MRAWLALAALLGSLAPAPRPAAAATPGEAPERYRQVAMAMRHLVDEEVAEARALVEPLLQAYPDDAGVDLAAGVLRLHEQRYDEAVRLLEASEAASPGTPGDWLDLARKALEVTRGYQRAEGRHFVIFHPKGKDEVLVPYLLEMLEAQRAALERALGRVPDDRVAVEIVESTRDLARLSTLTEEEIKTSGTIAICKFNKLMVTSPKALLRGYDWLDTAAHEYVHYVVTRHTHNLAPIWLHEGIAKWWESRWRGAGGEDYEPSSAALVKRAIETNGLVTFERMHPSMAKLPTQEMASLAYAQVLLAVEYLVGHGGTPVVARVLDLVRAGAPADAAVAQALGTTWPEFMAAWRAHMATRPLPKGGAQALRRLRFQDDPKEGGPWAEWADLPDQASRNHARLGQLMRERGRWTAARVEYKKAVDRAGAKVPILANQYAIAAIMSGQKAEAERVLGEAITWTPDYAALRVQLARLLLERKAYQDAREHLVMANRQDPFDPEIHAGLAMAAEGLGDPGGASRERRFAEILQGSHGPAGAPGHEGREGQGHP